MSYHYINTDTDALKCSPHAKWIEYNTISDRHFPINEGIISGFTSQKIKPI